MKQQTLDTISVERGRERGGQTPCSSSTQEASAAPALWQATEGFNFPVFRCLASGTVSAQPFRLLSCREARGFLEEHELRGISGPRVKVQMGDLRNSDIRRQTRLHPGASNASLRSLKKCSRPRRGVLTPPGPRFPGPPLPACAFFSRWAFKTKVLPPGSSHTHGLLSPGPDPGLPGHLIKGEGQREPLS